jgi:hypothetical protein
MTRDTRAPITEHPLALGSFRSWLKLLRESGGIERRFVPRVAFVTLSTFVTSPLRYYERIRYGETVDLTSVHPAPIFIVGHWRTGTTYLHNLICQDRNLGFVSTFQGIAPGFCLVGAKRLKPLLAKWADRAHHTRVIDNIPLCFDAPQEEEFALANLSPHSSLHLYTLPAQAARFFERYALFEGLPEQTLQTWVEMYMGVLRKASLRTGGKRLVLKNPANSGRIRTLLALFPDARFIHIYRNPYDVFLSTRWVYQTLLPRLQVQEIGAEQADALILHFYVQLMRKFLADRALIPEGNLVEVRFEDLEAAPLAQVHRVYEALRLPGYAEAEPGFRAYLASTANYEKNEYKLTDEVIAQVNGHWQFAFDEWGYDRLEPSPTCKGRTQGSP